jgi:hypothetical protein
MDLSILQHAAASAILPGRFCSRCRHERVLLLDVSVLLQTVLPLIILLSYFGCLVFSRLILFRSELRNGLFRGIRNTLDFFEGPKKSRFSGPTPSNAPRNDVALLKTVPRHENNSTLIVTTYFRFRLIKPNKHAASLSIGVHTEQVHLSYNTPRLLAHRSILRQ